VSNLLPFVIFTTEILSETRFVLAAWQSYGKTDYQFIHMFSVWQGILAWGALLLGAVVERYPGVYRHIVICIANKTRRV